MTNLLKNLLKKEDGGAAVEYALIVGLIALAIVVTAGMLGDAIDTKFSQAAFELDNANN
jgi:pilus assembly protein Flp/PilA